MTTLAFLDCETTGLDPDQHEIWEVGLILRDENGDHEHTWQLPVDLGRADPIALNIGRFHERRKSFTTGLDRFSRDFARLTHGAHLVGAVISFDEERLRRLLRRHHACPTWHYHLVDTEALVAGQYSIQPPWDSNALSRLVGVDPDDFDRHTALGDAAWARALFDAVMAGRRA
jgi:DNA polymerase III epsilon subunit-like protein